MRRHLLVLMLAGGFALAGCGGDDDEQSAEVAPAATRTAQPTSEPTDAPTADATQEATAADCRAGGWDIYISGDRGLSCREAKKIHAAFLAGKKVPAAWECAVAACTKVEADGTVRDFYWKAR